MKSNVGFNPIRYAQGQVLRILFEHDDLIYN